MYWVIATDQIYTVLWMMTVPLVFLIRIRPARRDDPPQIKPDVISTWSYMVLMQLRVPRTSLLASSWHVEIVGVLIWRGTVAPIVRNETGSEVQSGRQWPLLDWLRSDAYRFIYQNVAVFIRGSKPDQLDSFQYVHEVVYSMYRCMVGNPLWKVVTPSCKPLRPNLTFSDNINHG